MFKKISILLVAGLIVGLLGACQAPLDAGGVSGANARAAAPATWDRETIYTQGNLVAWKSHAWKAGWWTKGEEPGTTGEWGVWKDQGMIGTDTTPPTAPGSPVVSGITSSGATITWIAATDNVGVAGYRIVLNNGAPVTVTGTSHSFSGLQPKTTYAGTILALDGAGLTSPTVGFSFTTSDQGTGPVTTSGYIDFHLHLGVSSPQDKLVLDGDNYTDLIMSNFVAGAMCGHLIRTYYPGMQYSRDYLYGSIMGQLLQENLATGLYRSSSDLIDSDPSQQAVMAAGQGGPYQINNYAVDMVAGTYQPQGHSLINFVALQKNIGYRYADAATQNTKVTPPSFNNKYYSPILTAYFHYLDFVALVETGKGAGGWVTPWQPYYDNALVRFKDLPENFLEVILNVSYNQGSYGGLVKEYSQLGVNATAATIATVRNYQSVWGQEWYHQYPYQVMYYLDQLYGKPIPVTSPTDLVTRAVHVAFPVVQLTTVFSKVFQTLAYLDASGQYGFISDGQARSAFTAALAQSGIAAEATLDLSNAANRAKIFDLLEKAIAGLEISLNGKFNQTVTRQL